MPFLRHFQERNLERRINQLERAQDTEEIYDCADTIFKLSNTLYENPEESPYRKSYLLSKAIVENYSPN